jgi:hypothetical protein
MIVYFVNLYLLSEFRLCDENIVNNNWIIPILSSLIYFSIASLFLFESFPNRCIQKHFLNFEGAKIVRSASNECRETLVLHGSNRNR